MKVKATFLLDQDQVTMVPMLFAGAKLVSVGDDTNSLNKKDPASVFRRTGLTKHQHMFKLLLEKPQETLRWRYIVKKMLDLGYSAGGASTMDDFIKAGLAARISRGEYRLTALGLQTKVEDIATIEWPSNAYFYRGGAVQNKSA